MARMAIVTAYHGPTTHKGARMSARVSTTRNIYRPYDDNLDLEGNHRQIADELVESRGWPKIVAGGVLPNGDYCWIVKGLS